MLWWCKMQTGIITVDEKKSAELFKNIELGQPTSEMRAHKMLIRVSCTHKKNSKSKKKNSRFVDKVNRARKITRQETTFSIYLKLLWLQHRSADSSPFSTAMKNVLRLSPDLADASEVVRTQHTKKRVKCIVGKPNGFAVNSHIRCQCKSLIGASDRWQTLIDRLSLCLAVSSKVRQPLNCSLLAMLLQCCAQTHRMELIKCKEKSHQSVEVSSFKKTSNSSLQQCNLTLLQCNVTLRPREKPNSLPSHSRGSVWLCCAVVNVLFISPTRRKKHFLPMQFAMAQKRKSLAFLLIALARKETNFKAIHRRSASFGAAAGNFTHVPKNQKNAMARKKLSQIFFSISFFALFAISSPRRRAESKIISFFRA